MPALGSVSTPEANENDRQRPRCRKIVLGLTAETNASILLRLASQLARANHATITIVHSVEPPPARPGFAQSQSPAARHAMLSAQSAMRKLIREDGSLGSYPHELRLSFHAPVDLVLKTAREEHADLIILGSHRQQAVSHLLVGSVSEAVVSQATCPVLVAGPNCRIPPQPLQRVLFASDLGGRAVQTCKFAAHLAEGLSSSLYMLHVVDRSAVSPADTRQAIETQRTIQLLNQLCSASCERLTVIPMVVFGDPGQQILRVARDVDAGVIVVGASELGLLGSHTPWRTLTHIVRHSDRPIVCVGPRATSLNE